MPDIIIVWYFCESREGILLQSAPTGYQQALAANDIVFIPRPEVFISSCTVSFTLPPYGRTVEYKLLVSINSEHICDFLVIKCPDCAGTTTDLLCGKIEVLADMPCIEMNETVRPFTVSPCHPVDHCRPDERNR